MPRNYTAATRWYRTAAERGNNRAKLFLAFHYEIGIGVPLNRRRAAELYGEVAEKGFSRAQENLGGLYELGFGVPQDDVAAYKWSHIAAARGAKQAAKNRDRIMAKMASGDLSKAKRLAREWLAKRKKK